MLTAVNTITSRAKLLITRLVAAEAESGDWAADGDKTMEAWLGHHTGAGYGPAKSDVEIAQTLQDLPALGQALEAGTVTVEHVRATSRQYANGSDAQNKHCRRRTDRPTWSNRPRVRTPGRSVSI